MGAAGLRIGALCGAEGLERAVAAAVVAMTLVVVETLALGRAGLSSSSAALGVAAVASWLAARVLVPAPAIGMPAAAGAAWRVAGPGTRAALGALALGTLGWIGWQLRHPYIGLDGFLYHLALAGAWAHDGHAGSIVNIVEGLPVANYPVTNEVGLSWSLAISQSWVWASVVTPLFGVLIAAGGWLALRRAAVPRGLAAMAIAAFLTQPVVATQFGGPLTDVAAVAWLVAAVGLCAASRENARLMPIALLAAALSFGTKTTGTVVLLAALAWAAWPHRRALRGLARPLVLATMLGIAAGGLWALRNLIDHGSPLWPFTATSFGDPVPAALKPFDASFLSHPRAMLSGRTDDYLRTLAGAAVLLVLPLVAVLASRTRAVLTLAVASILAVLVWAAAPYTGIAQSTALATGATRYLLPALVCCTAAGAVAGARASRPGRLLVLALFAASIVISVARTWKLGFPYVPSSGSVVGFAALGAAAALIAGLRLPSRLLRALPAGLAAVAVAVLAAIALNSASGGYVQRHTEAGLGDSTILRALQAVPGLDGSGAHIWMAPTTIALLRGDHLEHDLSLVAGDTPCQAVIGHVTDDVLILQKAPTTPAYRRLHACLGGIKPVFEDASMELFIGA